MNILKITNGVPAKYSEGALKRNNPRVSFPSTLNDAVLASYDCYNYTIDSKPEYNPVLQNLNPVFEQRSDGWVQTFVVVDFSLDVSKRRLKESIASDRWDTEHGGVVWTDINSETFRIATDSNSQMKMTSVLAVVTADPTSTAYENWKLEKQVEVEVIDTDENELPVTRTELVWESVFRTNTREDFFTIVGMAGGHIEKCFKAESLAVALVNAGDLTVTFQSEYEKL